MVGGGSLPIVMSSLSHGLYKHIVAIVSAVLIAGVGSQQQSPYATAAG